MPELGVTLALAAIRGYQRFLSPYKGFGCAYRCHTGCASCSALGFRAIRRYGVWCGVGVLRRRFERCALAHRRYSGLARSRLKQAGHCDLSCDLPCDGPDLHCRDFAICDAPCDCGSWGDDKNRKKKKGEPEYMHIPPFKAGPTMAGDDGA
jgi:putative component of membrane protein insertase Oxa1/YidC/SpoIIIJ protein YidD